MKFRSEESSHVVSMPGPAAPNNNRSNNRNGVGVEGSHGNVRRYHSYLRLFVQPVFNIRDALTSSAIAGPAMLSLHRVEPRQHLGAPEYLGRGKPNQAQKLQMLSDAHRLQLGAKAREMLAHHLRRAALP